VDELRAAVPAECSGEPSNCPENEGRGCACSVHETPAKHHWQFVVAQAREILEPMYECDPAIRKWLATPGLDQIPRYASETSAPPNQNGGTDG